MLGAIRGNTNCGNIPDIAKFSFSFSRSKLLVNFRHTLNIRFYSASKSMNQIEKAQRKALVIGNAAYAAPLTLRNPVNDAKIIAKVLVDLSFDVDLQTNLDIQSFVAVVSRFANNLQGSDAGVFYYAGHGAQVNGDNFLVPIGCEPSNTLDLETGAVKLQTLLDALGNASVTSIFFLDCCRNNPLPRWATKGVTGRALTLSPGLASPTIPNGSFIAFSTMNDAVAEDGEGANSVFTEMLSQHITSLNASISNVMATVRGAVRKATSDRQIPMDWSTLTEPYVFNFEKGPIIDRMDSEDEYWTYVKDGNNLELLQSFVLRYPSGKYRSAAIGKIDQLKRLKWKQELWGNTGKIISIVFGVFILAIIVSWFQFTTIEGGDLVGGDMYIPVDVSTTNPNNKNAYFGYFGCKLACIFSRSCKAFTFDHSPTGQNKEKGICYLKNDYSLIEANAHHTSGYIWRPLFDRQLRKQARPDEQSNTRKYKYDWDRVYVGGAVLNADGTPAPTIAPISADLKKNDWQFGSQVLNLLEPVASDPLTKRFRHGFMLCQALCDRLQACSAFTYANLKKTCKLLSGAPSILQHGDVELQFSAVISGKKID
jgi:hypothetical protein